MDLISTDIESTALRVGGGVVASLTESVSVYAVGDYTTELDGESRETLEGNVGVRVRW